MPPTRTTTKIEATPLDGAMSLDELGRFVQDAMRAGASGTDRPVARVRLNGHVKALHLVISSEPA